MTRRTLGVAVVGLGVGRAHALAFAGDPRCRLLRVHDHDRGRMEQAAAELPGAKPADSFAELLADPGVEVVSIASYDADHAGQVVAALAAGKHVFCEKPLARSLEELRQIRRALRASPGRCLGSNLVLRAAPLYGWLKRAIALGELGRVYAFDGDYLYGRLEKITAGWRAEEPGYSVILGGAIHLVDLLLWLTRERPVTVVSCGSRVATAGTRFVGDDFVAATYTFASGLIGRITANFGCVHRHQHVVRVFGTRATVLHDDAGPRLHTGRGAEARVVPLDLLPLPGGKGDLIPRFVDRILDETAPAEAQAHPDLDVVAACVAADRARLEGKSVEIEYV